MRLNKLVMMTGMLCVLASGAVYAEEDEGGHRGPLMDFTKADTNADGKISYDEFKAAHEKRIQAQFKRLDKNGDGFIDQAEKETASKRLGDLREKMQDKAAK